MWMLIATTLYLCNVHGRPAAASREDFSELAKMLQHIAAAQIPKIYEDKSKWGATIPMPDKKLAFQKLRKKVETEDGAELPHGTWKRVRFWLDDPARDLKITVHDFKRVDGKTSKLRVGARIAGHGELEQQNWSKGIRLLGVKVVADPVVNILIDCDVSTSIKANGYWPELAIEPHITRCKIDLVEFNLKRLGIVDGKTAEQLGKELEEILRRLVRRQEPKVVEKANLAIAKSLKEGKNSVSFTALNRLLGGGKPGSWAGQAAAIAVEAKPEATVKTANNKPGGQ